MNKSTQTETRPVLRYHLYTAYLNELITRLERLTSLDRLTAYLDTLIFDSETVPLPLVLNPTGPLVINVPEQVAQ